MSENFKKPLDRPDRVLGDEWADWDGKSDENIKEGPGLFIAFALLVVASIDAVLFLLYYLTFPRLTQFKIEIFVFLVILGWAILTVLFWLQLALTVYLDRDFFLGRRQIAFVFNLVFARVFKFAGLFGILRDRMGHSFVKVSNAVVKGRAVGGKDKKLLILLPRCLSKEVLQGIYKLKEQYPLEIFTVSGGELARKKVKEICPSAIIGVACERDLVSGIRDVADKIPVIGIPNQRPNGPCKDTLVDLDELNKAVKFYLGG